MRQGSLRPGLLPKLLRELHFGRRSGFLRLVKGDETVDLDFNEGGILRVCGIRGRDSLIQAFSWDGGDYAFMEGPAAASTDDDQALDLDLPMLLRDGLGDGAAAAVSHVLGDLDDVVVLEAEDRRALASATTDRIVLRYVDGTRSMRQIIEQVPLSPEDAQRSLAVLLCACVLQVRPASPAAAVAEKPNAPEEAPQPRAAALETEEEDEETTQATTAAPRRGLDDLQGRLDDRILLDLLGIAKGEMPVDPVDNALVADDAIRKATTMMAGSDPFGAIRLLEAAIPRIYVKELKREAQVLLARAYTRNPRWVRRGEEILQTVIREDPSLVDAYLALGVLYSEKGLRTRAVAMFSKVLELRPDHILAAAELRSLTVSAPARKLFGRV
jgi:tetratricopeptide (TPR) repeat protein